MRHRPAQLNIVFRITSANGWRTEWDMAFREGAPSRVTLAQYAPNNTVSIGPGPVELSPEEFFQRFAAEHPGVLADMSGAETAP
jgi:hypothetical protein